MESIAAAVIAITSALTPQTALVLGTLPTQEPEEYVENDQHALVNPAVVRILHKIKGELVVKPMRFDMDRKVVIHDPSVGSEVSVEVDEIMSGTGFMVSENGTIITNAHVVSLDTLRATVAANVLLSLLLGEFEQILIRYGPGSQAAKDYEAELEKMAEDTDSPEVKRLGQSALDLITFDDDGSRIVVLEQGAAMNTAERALDTGTRAHIIAISDDWLGDSRDVAVLKIQDSIIHVPAIALASSTKLDVNTPIAVYGYPGSTDISTSSATNVTVTQGRVTSVKQLPGSGIDAYQIDAKISKGSSGGPVVDAEGRVVGIVTLETGSEDGDNFGFTLPVQVIHDIIDEAGIMKLTTEYQAHMRTGLALQDGRHCKLAIESFESAHDIIVGDTQSENAVDKVIAECENLIAAGESVDSSLDELKEWAVSIGAVAWMLIGGGVILLIVVTGGGILLVRQLREGQKQIDSLEDELDDLEDDRPARPVQPEQPPVVMSNGAMQSAPQMQSVPQKTQVSAPETAASAAPTLEELQENARRRAVQQAESVPVSNEVPQETPAAVPQMHSNDPDLLVPEEEKGTQNALKKEDGAWFVNNQKTR